MAATCDFLLLCNRFRYFISSNFQLVRDCFKMFVFFGLNPFSVGKKSYSFCHSQSKKTFILTSSPHRSQIISFPNTSCLYFLQLSAWTTGGCLLSQINIKNLQKPLFPFPFEMWFILYLAAPPIMLRWAAQVYLPYSTCICSALHRETSSGQKK